MLNKVRTYLLYAFIFLLPWQGVWILREVFIGGEKFQYATIGLYGTDVILLVLLALHVPMLRKKIKHVKSKMIIGAAVFVIWAIVSIVWSNDQMLSLFFVGKMLLALGLISLIHLSQIRMSKIVLLLVTSAVIQSALGIWQFLSQSSFSSVLLGMSEYEAWKPGVSVLKNETGRWIRAYGGFPHPNILGGFLVMTFLTMGIWMVSSYKRSSKYANSLLYEAIVVIGIFLVCFGILLTFSRISWMSLCIGLLGIIWYGFRYSHRSSKRIIVGYASILLVGGIMLAGLFSENLFSRFNADIIKKEATISERVDQIDQVGVLLLKQPFIGMGAGGYAQALLDNNGTVPVWEHQPAHNVTHLVFVELGFVGGSLFCVGIISLLSVYTRRFIKKPMMYKYFPLLLALVPFLLLDHWLWTSHFGIVFLGLIIGIATLRTQEHNK